MASTFLRVAATADPFRFTLPITSDVSVGPKGNVFMFGGVGLASAIVAAERATGRETVWANAQFLSYARVGGTLELAVEVLSAGRNVSQVRVLASDAGVPIVTVAAALGSRAGFPDDQWSAAPPMPPPDACVARPMWPRQDAALMDRLDVRVAPDAASDNARRDGTRSDDGRTTMWIRARDGTPPDAALLALFADFVPSGLAAAFGRPGGGNSLDNNIRILRVVPTQWVLCDIRIAGAARGFGHGAIHLYADDGTLMATGSQSAIVRFMDGE